MLSTTIPTDLNDQFRSVHFALVGTETIEVTLNPVEEDRDFSQIHNIETEKLFELRNEFGNKSAVADYGSFADYVINHLT